MKQIAVISPHTDDAAFSVSEYIMSSEDARFTIISVMAQIPNDSVGRDKHERLRREHSEACRRLGVREINGPFLDDVYGPNDVEELALWLFEQGVNCGFDEVWGPLGIHHPDHVQVAEAVSLAMADSPINTTLLLYEELPYRVLYPNLTVTLANDADLLGEFHLRGYDPMFLESKKRVCRAYASQVDQIVERCIYAPERLWEIG